MSTTQTTDTITGAEIHPELPMPHWATERYLDDEVRLVVDESSTSLGRIEIELSRTWLSDGSRNYGDNVSLWWDNDWPEDRSERATMTVLPARIPALIQALQAAFDRFSEDGTDSVETSA